MFGFFESPVIYERIIDGLTDKLTVLLQGVECILDCLVNSFLDGATHLFNLVHTATWLRRGTKKNPELHKKSETGKRGTSLQSVKCPQTQ